MQKAQPETYMSIEPGKRGVDEQPCIQPRITDQLTSEI